MFLHYKGQSVNIVHVNNGYLFRDSYPMHKRTLCTSAEFLNVEADGRPPPTPGAVEV